MLFGIQGTLRLGDIEVKRELIIKRTLVPRSHCCAWAIQFESRLLKDRAVPAELRFSTFVWEMARAIRCFQIPPLFQRQPERRAIWCAPGWSDGLSWRRVKPRTSRPNPDDVKIDCRKNKRWFQYRNPQQVFFYRPIRESGWSPPMNVVKIHN